MKEAETKKKTEWPWGLRLAAGWWAPEPQASENPASQALDPQALQQRGAQALMGSQAPGCAWGSRGST